MKQKKKKKKKKKQKKLTLAGARRTLNTATRGQDGE